VAQVLNLKKAFYQYQLDQIPLCSTILGQHVNILIQDSADRDDVIFPRMKIA